MRHTFQNLFKLRLVDHCVRFPSLFRTAFLGCVVLAFAMTFPGSTALAFRQTEKIDDQDAPLTQEGLTDDDLSKLDEWIQQLGSPQFSQRESAKKAIRDFGQKAIPKLKQATRLNKFRDFEIQLAAKQLLEALNKDSREAILQAFLDGEGELPGWTLFAKSFGDQQDSRELYAGMYRVDSEFLSDVAEGEIDVSKAMNYATVSSRSSSKNMLERVALGWYSIGSLIQRGRSRAGSVSQAYRVSMLNMLTRSNLKSPLESHASKATFRKIIHQTMALFQNKQPLLNPKVSVLLMLGDEASVQKLRGYLEDPEMALGTKVYLISRLIELPVEVRPLVQEALQVQMQSVQVFGTFVPAVFMKGKQEELPETLEVRVSDVALLSAIILEKRDPAKFGFSKSSAVDKKKIEIRLSGFADDQSRRAAMKAWASREAMEDGDDE